MQACGDLHLGDLSARDDRTKADRELFLDTLPPSGQLILAGDILDWLRFGHGVFEANVAILKALAERYAIYVRGNHCPPAPLLAEYYPAELICDILILGRVLVMHGHQGDLANGRFHVIGDTIIRIGNSVGKLSPRLEDWAAKIAGKITAKGRYGDASMVRDYAVNLAMGMTVVNEMRTGIIRRIETVVCGHSHVRERGEAAMGNHRVEYVNLGCFERGKPIWTAI